MRSTLLATALMASLITPALAQAQGYGPGTPPPGGRVPPGANPATGARPGNVIGTGMSLPMGTSASNIDQHDTRSLIAPNLPSPELGPNATPVDYLRAAQSALSAGQTGVAQQALEEAQTRLLDRSVEYGQTNNPSDNPAVRQIAMALHALSAGDTGQCVQFIQSAIPAAQAMAQ
jgi:hypothetical protein